MKNLAFIVRFQPEINIKLLFLKTFNLEESKGEKVSSGFFLNKNYFGKSLTWKNQKWKKGLLYSSTFIFLKVLISRNYHGAL